VSTEVEDLLRTLAPQVLGTLSRRYGDFDGAEDAVQEALLQATVHWSHDGLPTDPRAWLAQAAGRRLIDQWRVDRSRRERELRTTRSERRHADVVDQDDSLIVLFMCCHPALTPASAIALTLRAVGGLDTAEIARAYLVPEATMAQRISRAKPRIRDSGEDFSLPAEEAWPERLRSVLHVLYLMFNEGYTASGGSALLRPDLSREAIRLSRMMHRLLPDEPEIAGMLALMLFIDARRPARTTPDGELVPLPEQDRSRWHRELIEEGRQLLEQALTHCAVGEYQLQAAKTNWHEIVTLYALLEQMTGNPVVTLNRAVAVAMAQGPLAGLAVLDEVAERLAGQHRLDAVRAHLLEMAGDRRGPAELYAAAARRTTNLPEQRFLAGQAARVRAHAEGGPSDE
jgi:RNA polymerase sigma factor (sigma-70 family)